MAMSRNKRGSWGGWVAAALIALAIYTADTDMPAGDPTDDSVPTEAVASVEEN